MKQMILLFSILIAVASAVSPVVEYISSGGINARSSTAVDPNWTDSGVFTQRDFPISISSMASVTLINYPSITNIKAIDSDRGLLIASNTLSLMTSTDGAAWSSPFADITETQPMKSFYDENNHNGVVQVAVCGPAWLMWLGRNNVTPDDVTDLCRTYRSTDMGETWTLVHSSKYSTPVHVDVDGNRVVWGNYTVTTGGNHWNANDRNVYLSEDGGLTFSNIQSDPGFANPGNADEVRHVHACVFDPDNRDRIWVAYGDYDSSDHDWSNVALLTRPFAGSQWDKYVFDGSQQCGFGFVKDGCFYAGTEGAKDRMSIFRYNPVTHTMARIFFQPAVDETRVVSNSTPENRTGPYGYSTRGFYSLAATPVFWEVKKVGDIYIAAAMTWATSVPSDDNLKQPYGLYVSADAEHWTRIWNDQSKLGVTLIHGALDGYIYCDGRSATGDDYQLLKIAMPTVVSRKGFLVEKGHVNNINKTKTDAAVFDADGDYLTNTLLSDWARGTANEAHSSEAGGVYSVSGRYLKYRSTDTSPLAISNSPWNANGIPPTSGNYITYIFTARAETVSGQAAQNANHWYLTPYTYETNVVFGEQGLHPLYSEFTTYLTTMYAKGTVTNTKYWMLYLSKMADRTVPSPMWVGLDAVDVIYDTDRWRGFGTTFAPVGSALADDYIVIPAPKLTQSWSITFDWIPLNGSRAFASDVPVCTVKGTLGKYIRLYWNFSGKANANNISFRLYDGTDSVQTSVRRWLHWDNIKVAITTNGTGSYLYMYDPQSGFTSYLGTNVNLVNSVPEAFILGNNNTENLVGTGCYTNIRIFDSQLTQDEVKSVFNHVGGYECPELVGDLNSDCDVNLADLAIFSSNWLQYSDPNDRE